MSLFLAVSEGWYKVDKIWLKTCRIYKEESLESNIKYTFWFRRTPVELISQHNLPSAAPDSSQHLYLQILICSLQPLSSSRNWPLSQNPSPLWLWLAGRSRRANLLVISLGMPWRPGGGGGRGRGEDGGGWCEAGPRWGRSDGDWPLWAWQCAASEHWQCSGFLPLEPGTFSQHPSSAPPCLS